MTAALVIGEALVDVVRDGAARAAHPGGSPLNVAVGLARLGVDVELLTRIGRDDEGALIRDHLAANGVGLRPGSEVEGPTGIAEVVLDPGGAPSYRFAMDWDLPPAAVPEGTPLVHTGSIAAFLQPGADRVLEWMDGARAAGALTTFDPNVRPALVGGHAEAVARCEAVASRADVIKLSDEDAGWLYPGRDEGAVLDRLLALGVRVAVMTRGARGAVLAMLDMRVEVPAVPVRVVDTIGAGDAFMSSLIRGVAARLPIDSVELRELGATAARAAAITVGRAGAQPPTAADLGPTSP